MPQNLFDQLALGRFDKGDDLHLAATLSAGNWDVAFKLHAPYNTTVEGVFQAGKLERLVVTPESRRNDVENKSAK